MAELFYEKTLLAESLREQETHSAVRIESVHRGRKVRLTIASDSRDALFIERCTRGHLGRQRARRLRIERDTRWQLALFNSMATTVQKRFRAYHTRKYRHNFYARKAYVASVVQRGEAVRYELQRNMDEQVRDRLEQQETQARERVNTLSMRLHHLRSTATCTGIYNSAYHVGHHPTAFGVPVEEHLRTAIRPVIKRELAVRNKSLRPVQSLPPIKPQKTEMSYDYVKQEERQEKWIAKTKRIAGQDFNPNGGQRANPFPGSINIGTDYTGGPETLERKVEKNKWVTDEPFYTAVPLNRIVSSAGSQRGEL